MRAPFRWHLLLIACIVALAGTFVRSGTFPEPSKYPTSWELKFHHNLPKRIVVNLPNKGSTAFWYVTYNVANLSDAEQQFLPTFEMVTNDGKVLRSDFAIPGKVFQAIKSAEGNDLLQRAPEIAGAIRAGEDSSKDGVAIWEEPTTRMGNFQIFAAGLSGEAVQVKDADGKPQNNPDGTPVILHKTFEMDFSIYGDELYPDKDTVHAKTEKWIMR
jgi:hypothetical protein